jgi:hypothetical protein
MLATPPHAFVPDASPCLASSDRRLAFIGLDNVFFGIDSYDCLDRVTDNSSCVLGFGKSAVCIVLKTKPVRWFDQKKPEPKSSPVF